MRVPVYNLNIWKVNDVSKRFPSVSGIFLERQRPIGKYRPYWAAILAVFCMQLSVHKSTSVDGINIWKVNDVSNRFRSVQVSSDGESMRGGRLLQVTNTCEAAVGERVQCCDRETSMQCLRKK